MFFDGILLVIASANCLYLLLLSTVKLSTDMADIQYYYRNLNEHKCSNI